MATQLHLLNPLYVKGWQPLIFKRINFGLSGTSRYTTTKRNLNGSSRVLQCSSSYTEVGHCSGTIFSVLDSAFFQKTLDSDAMFNIVSLIIPKTSHASSDFMVRLFLADLDPSTAKLAIGFLGPFLSVFGFLFILRIVMSWYPKLPVGKFPYVIAYAPTEPLLIPTRKVIPPLAGVDVTPVVWFGLISFLNEILVGPQGLLVLLSQQVNN